MKKKQVIKAGLIGALWGHALHSYFLMSRSLTIGVRAIVRSSDGKFLLVKHSYTPGWHLPGGGVEKGETAENALRHELRQETGLNIIGRPELHGLHYNSGVSKRDHVLTYICTTDGEVVENFATLEIIEVGYFGIDDLPADLDPGTGRRIQEIVENLEPQAVW